MEIRRLQKTGGSSFTITLPKKWIEKCRLQDKDPLQIKEEGFALTIQPTNAKKVISRSIIAMDMLSDNMLTRELIAHYISGVDEIVIKSDKILPETRNKIRAICNMLIGFELLDETSEEVVIKNVFDPAKFPMPQNIEKMFLITTSMLEDAYNALATQDVILAKDVVSRDFEIDKLQIAITRHVYTYINNNITPESDLGQIDLYFYQNIATQLERIADHTVKIAQTVSTEDITGTPISTSILVVTSIVTLLEKAKEMVETLDKSVAHEILDSNEDIEKHIYSRKTKKHKSSFLWDVLEDSLDRICGYIMNMAEIAIDQAVLKEEAM